MARRREKPLTKKAFAFMVEGVAAQLASRELMPWWSCTNEQLKRQYRRRAYASLLKREIAGIPSWQDVRTLADPLSKNPKAAP